MRIGVAERFKSQHLFGATVAQQHMSVLLGELFACEPGEVVVLDFAGTDQVSASYLKATFGRLLLAATRSVDDGEARNKLEVGADRLDIFPMVAGLGDETRAELDVLLEALSKPGVEALRSTEGVVHHVAVRGPLPGVLRETLACVVKDRRATALALADQDERVKNPTAWNNRLFDLYRLRLIRREKEGRQWVYLPLAIEVTLG